MNNDLPLIARLKRALLLALLLGLWAPVKILWEQNLEEEQNHLRYRHVMITRELRDQLGQGLTFGLLSGMGSVVADFTWLNVEIAWENQQWFRVKQYIDLCTTLQPRSTLFWMMGGWQLAFNASQASLEDTTQPPLRRMRAHRYWIEQGRQVLIRGTENNPDSYQIWNQLAMLYQIRLQDYHQAAYCYEQASLCPGAPTFLERFPAKMYERAGDDLAAYQAWVKLWNRLSPEEKQQPAHWQEIIIASIKKLEDKLNIPPQKRIFPN